MKILSVIKPLYLSLSSPPCLFVCFPPLHLLLSIDIYREEIFFKETRRRRRRRRRRERERERERDGSRRSSKGVCRALLLDLRQQPGEPREPLPRGFDADVRGAEDPGLAEHRRQAHLPPLPPVPAQNLHRRLPALRPGRRHARLRLRQSPASRRAARPQVQSDVPFDADTARKLLCVERHISVELCLGELLEPNKVYLDWNFMDLFSVIMKG